MPSILLFGATGLVGSHLILDLKFSHPNYPITVYLRNKNLDAYLTATAGVRRIVHGTFDETTTISALAAEHDIVINVGSSWDVGLSEAIIAGLKKEKNGEGKVLIHMSGTGNWVDETWKDGASHEGTKVWDDDNPEDMKLVNPSMLNGGPDTVVLTAGNTTEIKTYIIYPPIIYGHSAGPGKALGVVQYLMKAKAEELGFIPYIGIGTTSVNSLHTKDVSRFVLLVLSKAISTSSSAAKQSPYERCFNIGGKVLIWKEIANAFAKALAREGIVKEGVARSVSLDEAGEGEIPKLMASDALYTTRRSQRLGLEVKEVGLIEFLEEGEDLF